MTESTPEVLEASPALKDLGAAVIKSAASPAVTEGTLTLTLTLTLTPTSTPTPTPNPNPNPEPHPSPNQVAEAAVAAGGGVPWGAFIFAFTVRTPLADPKHTPSRPLADP